MKRRKFVQATRGQNQHVQADNRVQLLPEATRNFVRAAQTIGSPQRAIEELVRNSIIHGRAKEVNVTFGTVNIKQGGDIPFLQVQDDGLGIDEVSTRDFIGILHCSSVMGNRTLMDRDNTRGLHRGEALKALAALSSEFQVETTWAQMTIPDEVQRNLSIRGGLTSAPSKPRRKFPVHNTSLRHSNQVEATVFSAKNIRDNQVIAFRSVTNKTPSDLKTGTSIKLFGLFHKHQVRLRHHQLASSSHGADQLHIAQVRSAVHNLALAYPYVIIRLYHTKSTDPDTTWMQSTSLLNDDILYTSANNTNGFPSQSIYCKAIKHRFASLFDKEEMKKINVLDVIYAEGDQSMSQHPAALTSTLKSKRVMPSLSLSTKRWEVCGVLFQRPNNEESKSSPLSRSRQNELIFVNHRFVQHHTALADTIQKICTSYVPSVWSFLLHIVCPHNDIDLVIDETKSYSSIRQRDRLETLITDAIIVTLRENGIRSSSKTFHSQKHTIKSTEDKKNAGPKPGNLLRAVSGRKLNSQRQNSLGEDDYSSKCSTRSSFAEIFYQSTRNVQDSAKFEDAFFSTTALVKGLSGPAEKQMSFKSGTEVNNGMTWTRSRLKALGRDIDSLSHRSGSGIGTPIKISKDMLSRAEFVAQLDAKFIIVVMDRILCVVDQHAADERVGLERLEDALEMNLSSNEGQECKQEFFDLRKLKNININNLLKQVTTTDLKPMILSPIQSSAITANNNLLKKWKFDFDHDPGIRQLKLTATPCIGGDKVATQKDFIQFVQDLSSGASSSLTKPAFAKRVLASYACRYAIMFGDVLDDNDCKNLLSSLSKCALSFNCAHGRPSVIPLLDLNGAMNSEIKLQSSVHNSRVKLVPDNVPLRFQKRKRNPL